MLCLACPYANIGIILLIRLELFLMIIDAFRKLFAYDVEDI